jgi:hypothetical protein
MSNKRDPSVPMSRHGEAGGLLRCESIVAQHRRGWITQLRHYYYCYYYFWRPDRQSFDMNRLLLTWSFIHPVTLDDY